MERRSVLLTGGTGFIGRFVLDELLKQEMIVHCLINNRLPHITNENLHIHSIDLLNAGERQLIQLFNDFSLRTLRLCGE